MQKRNARLVAQDSEGHRIEVLVKFHSRNGLTRSEVKTVTKEAIRKIAEQIQFLHYVDFGADNTRVEM